MKARLPYQYDPSAKASRKRAVAAAMLLFARALYETGKRKAFICRWENALNKATVDVAGYKQSGYFNREWADELMYWAEKMQLKLPERYILIIDGTGMAHGAEQMLLVLLEAFALTYLGYGKKRIHRVWDKYAELSGMYGSKIAKYSARELMAWADEKGIPYKEGY